MAPDSSETDIAALTEISEEEKLEIRALIDDIAEQNLRALSAGAEAERKKVFKARKNGGLFPILVNAFAALALAVGLFLLLAMQSEIDVQAREGTRAFSDVERALIEEIRRQTNAALAAQDREISLLLASLAEIEAQLEALAIGGEALTPEQEAVQQRLLAEQDERREALTTAREERSRILDAARSQEATLRIQLAATDARDTDMDAARAELAELSREQAQAAAVESQIAGLFASVHRQVADGSFDDAGLTISLLREFLYAPSVQALRGIQSRRELYVQAAGTLETLLEEHRAAYEAMRDGVLPADREAEARHREEIERLESVIAEMEGRGLEGQIMALQAEHSAEVGRLQEENARLQGQLSELQQIAERLIQLQQVLQ